MNLERFREMAEGRGVARGMKEVAMAVCRRGRAGI